MSDATRMTVTVLGKGFVFRHYDDHPDDRKIQTVPPGEYEIEILPHPKKPELCDWFVLTYEGSRLGGACGAHLDYEPVCLTFNIPETTRTEVKLRSAERLEGKLVIEVVADPRNDANFKVHIRGVPEVWCADSSLYSVILSLMHALSGYDLSSEPKDYLIHLNF